MHAQCGTTHTHTHQVCVPYNVLVDAGDAYSITITADQAVINTLRTTIVDSQLRLTTTQPGFSTQQPIRVTVTLPPGSLEGVQVASPQSSVVVQGPAGGDTLTATHTGAGGLFLLDLNASSLTVNAAGCDGTVIALVAYSLLHSTASILANGSSATPLCLPVAPATSTWMAWRGRCRSACRASAASMSTLREVCRDTLSVRPVIRTAEYVEVTGTASGLGKVYHAPSVDCTVTVLVVYSQCIAT